MRPVLFTLGPIGHEVTVMSYTSSLVAAVIVALGLGTAFARKRGIDGRKSFICLLVGLIAALIGARLVHWLTNPGSFDSANSVLSVGRSNLSGYAGLMIGVPAAAVSARMLGVNAWRLADSATPALAFAAALARVGCLLNGCCYGKPTHGLWGIVYPVGSNAHADQILLSAIGLFDTPLPVHPTQLYEAAAAILGGLIALWLLRAKRTDGIAFLAFVLWFTSFRWANHYLLSPSASFAAPTWLYPTAYALVIVLCSGALVVVKRQTGWIARRGGR